MILAVLLLLTGLTISAVAIYYSVLGLAAIFSAAIIPIVVMGTTLEIAKLVCASWLKANWYRAPVLMKTYMTAAVVVLMFITSMGIFGFLSKAHTDQSLVSGDVQSKIAIYDEKIATEKENIDAARKALSQMDAQVNERLSRSSDDKGAERAVQIRRQQQAERARLQKDITTAQGNISRLQAERAPIAAEVRKVEAEVGPIKYIAKFVYGDNPDANILEKAVTWVIIIIVLVFDPLAVIMLLAAQMTFGWLREEKKETDFKPDPWVADVGEKPTEEEKLPGPEKPTEVKITPETHPYLYKPWVGRVPEEFQVGPQVYRPENESPKTEENLTADNTQHTVDESATYKILPELEEESKKKDLHTETGESANKEREVEYVQNNEQNTETLWQKIQKIKGLKAIDQLYKQYSFDRFEGLDLSLEKDQDFINFVTEVQTKGPRFSNYSPEKLETYSNKIYELRKNKLDNSAR